jgi:uncharacterized repeat protein (TIGR02543 family)
MNGQRMFLVAFFGMLLCAGLFTGCDEVRDLFHPDGPTERVVTFDLQGGNINGATTTRRVSVKKGDTVGSAMPSNPTMTGYTFDGWWTAPSGGSRFTSSTEVTEDITVYARWTTGSVTTRTVIFDLQSGNINGLTANQTKTVDYGSWLGSNMPTNPSRSGYTFDGWYTATNGGDEPFTAYTMVSANITVYARWTTGSVTTRTVTFDLQGGNINGLTANQTKTVDYGSWLGSNMPSSPSRIGYTFGGWYMSPDGGGELFTSYTAVSASITVYAKWTLDTQSSSGISNISYSSVSGGEWILQVDGSRKSPLISDNTTTKARISFTSTAGASITILLTVSSEAGYDWAFIGQLDNTSATSTSGSYQSSVISGAQSVTLIIPISSAGDHFIDIGYEKDGSQIGGSDCAWFTVIGGEEEPTLSLAEWLTWISNNATEGGDYTYTLGADETIAPTTLWYSVSNVSITLNGGNTERTISLSSSGSLFTIDNGVTLTLGNNVSLQGISNNTTSLVWVNSGGSLVMESGSKISGNTTSYGGGVSVYGGTFTQSGGTISGNTATNGGGGVYVSVSGSDGTFTQSGGTINGNSTASNGGGVYVYGTFMMNGGTISGNTASSYYYYGYGGGVYVGGGTFTKQTGGIIYGANAEVGLKNTATNGDSYGHAVYVDGSPGKLRHNTAGSDVTLDSAVSGSAGGWEVPDSSLADWLAWLSNNAEEGGDYTYTLGADESIAPQSLSYSGKNVSISVDGGDAERTVSLNTTGALFTVGSYVTLTLGNNVTLQGLSDNTNSLVYVNSGALVMESGSKITGNTNSSGNGGGVYVDGTFTMNGGTISGNTASSGGGVYVSSSGTFTQSGGIISGNTAYNSGSGVYVYGTFTQSGGAISGNTASVGGGVFVYYSGTFTKQVGGTIYGANAEDGLKNTATSGNSYGHAVYVNYGYIRHNTAGSDVTLDSATSGAAGGWEELSGVQISLQTTSGDPSVYYYNTSLAVNQSGYFYTDSGYASYTWYWDGEVIAGATAYDYNLAAHSKTSGIYELLVVVTTSAGEKLSARCQVNINAN